MLSQQQLEEAKRAYGRNELPGAVAKRLGVTHSVISSLFYRWKRGAEIHESYEQEFEPPPKLPAENLRRISDLTQSALDALADLQHEIETLDLGESHADEARHKLRAARSAIMDARAEMRTRAALADGQGARTYNPSAGSRVVA